LLYKAAKATTEEEFNAHIQEMRNINPQSVQWLFQDANHPRHWAECYFPGQRYGHITSNIAESLNSWLAEAREKPILAMFEQIRHQLMKWFMDRRNIDININGILVSCVANAIKSAINNYARIYHILAANEDVYEIFSPQTGKNYVVNIHARTCTCYRWQKSGIPCAHALSVILNRKEQPEIYTQHFYHLNTYRATYINAIFPPNVDETDATMSYTVQEDGDYESDSDDGSDDDLLPPSTRRAPGRPKKRRIRGATEGDDRSRKRIFRCGRCNKEGHSRRTCEEVIQ
jgi:hypothetical protein